MCTILFLGLTLCQQVPHFTRNMDSVYSSVPTNSIHVVYPPSHTVRTAFRAPGPNSGYESISPAIPRAHRLDPFRRNTRSHAQRQPASHLARHLGPREHAPPNVNLGMHPIAQFKDKVLDEHRQHRLSTWSAPSASAIGITPHAP